jgi:hypothetical protein
MDGSAPRTFRAAATTIDESCVAIAGERLPRAAKRGTSHHGDRHEPTRPVQA